MEQKEKGAGSFVATMAAKYGKRLHRYFAARLSNRADVADLAQEVYMRLLRRPRHELILNPEAYLFTVASNALKEHTLRQSLAPIAIDFANFPTDIHSTSEPDPSDQAEVQQRIQRLERVITKLPLKAQATLLLHRRDGYTLEEIGAELGVSRGMAKKYLARAIAHVQCQLEREWK